MFAASKSARSAAAGDNKFNYVTLLLNGDGTNGKQNNTFVDGSTNNFTITRNGTPTQGSFSPYGSLWSNNFNGSNQYLSVADNAALQILGGGDFTLEAWVYMTSTPGVNGAIFACTTVGNGYVLRVNSSNILKWVWPGVAEYSIATISTNTWTHVAVCRVGSTLYGYVNGTQYTITSTNRTTDPNQPFNIACDTSQSHYFPGYISNARLVKGTAVYTATFTPPTAPLTSISGTGLLTCQSNRFRDASSNNFTITVNGSPSVQRFSPFEPSTSYTPAVNGGSENNSTKSDNLTVASTSALTTFTGDFTLEAWVYPTDTTLSTYWGILDARSSSGTAAPWIWSLASYSNGWLLQYFDGASSNGTVRIKPNTWTHVVMQRNGTTVTFFVNGVVDTTFTKSGTITGGSTTLMIANIKDYGIGGYGNIGYTSDIRIVNGTAVYNTSGFTPPTAPLTAVTNTSLLLNYTNAGISDSAAINDLITAGDAQVSTTQVKYGTASMKFDGTGDYLTIIDSPNLQLMAGDFTIEGWIYLAANGVVYGIVSKGTATTGWSVNVTIGNKLQFSYTLSNLTGATSLSATTWYHFAVVRSGTASGNLKVYLNGVADATSAGAVTDSFNQTSITYVGADRVATSQLNGYIDDLRITKGHARYTATFTPPTAALPTF